MRRLIWAILLLGILALPASAEDLYGPSDFDAASMLDGFPDELKGYLPEGDLFDAGQAMTRFSPSYLFSLLAKMAGAALSPALEAFSTLLGVVILSSSLGMLKGSVRSGAMGQMFEFVSGLCLMLVMYGRIRELFLEVQSYLLRLSGLMSTVLPITTAVSLAGGNLNAAAVSSSGMMLALNLVETLAAYALFPVLQIGFGMAIASGIGGGLKLGALTKQVRALFGWLLGFIGAIISAMMSFQHSIAVRSDSLSMRAVKFAASGAIPVVGGLASDAVSAVAGSLTLVRGTVGGVGILLILLLTLPLLCELLLTRLGVNLAGTAAEILGLDRERELLGEMGGFLGFLIAVCVIAALMFVYGMALFAGTAAAIGG